MAENEAHSEVAGYALGVLEPDEHAAFQRHLTVCGHCRAELAEFVPIVGLHRSRSLKRS